MFKNLKIGTKLAITFSIILAGLLVIGLFGLFSINAMADGDSYLYNNNLTGTLSLGRITENFFNVQVAVFQIPYEGLTADGAKEMGDVINAEFGEMDESIAAYQRTIANADDQKDFDTLKGYMTTYKQNAQTLAQQIAAGDKDGADASISQASDLAESITGTLDQMNERVGTSSATQDQSNTASSNIARIVIISVAALILAVSILLALLVTRSITRPVKKLMLASNKLALGDTRFDNDIKTKDEIGLLAVSFGKMVGAIKNLVTDANSLSDAAIQGQLTARADTNRHQGDFRKIMEGMNSTLDGIILPFEEFKAVLSRFSINDYTLNVEGEYQGDLKEMADAIRETHERLLSIQDDFLYLAKGDFSKLDMYKQIGARCENDQMMPSLIILMESVIRVIDEANMLSNAVMRGQVDVRCDASRFEGRYRELIEGINGILDTMAKPLGETISIMNRMAENDYTMEMSTDYQGAFGVVSEAINKVISTQNKVLHEINTAAMQVAAGTRQVSDGSQTLSQGATEQASSIEELTSTVTEIAAQTKQNAANAAQANELAVAASSSASKGNNQMKDMLGSMEEINESSSSISKIIKVIDDIAFQTNILALNAAVEAARAGAYGKGFAVVAEEVRNLAAKSAEAAKETTNLIEGSIKKVEQGTKYAKATAGALGEILENAERVATLVAEIAVASNEQATGIAQVDKGIEQVATVVQGNSATAQESAAASEELSSQAEMLHGMVGQFKLKSTGQDALKEPEKPIKEKAPALAGARFGKY